MSYFMTSSLGRSVPLDDWRSLRADTILKLLHGVSRSPFNPSNDPLEVEKLALATGLEILDVQTLLTALESNDLVELVSDPQGRPTAARLTERGLDWVSFQLSHVAAAGGTSG